MARADPKKHLREDLVLDCVDSLALCCNGGPGLHDNNDVAIANAWGLFVVFEISNLDEFRDRKSVV